MASRLGLTALVFAAAIGAAKAETCRASYYGAESGSRTASGERFNPMGLTAAHRAYRLGSHLHVCFAGRCVTVRVNDRGPDRHTGRCLDLARGAAIALGMIRTGTGLVSIERLD